MGGSVRSVKETEPRVIVKAKILLNEWVGRGERVSNRVTPTQPYPSPPTWENTRDEEVAWSKLHYNLK